MLNRLIEGSARRPWLVIAIVALGSVGGWAAMKQLPVDATPDLGDKQVIVFSRWDRSPDIIEQQVTYPIVTAMQGAPRVKTVRGISDFGYSYVYVTFQDGSDVQAERSQIVTYLSGVLATLPEGVKTALGPDANALGWVYQYVLEDRSGKHTLSELRAYQDWYLRYQLQSVPGVAEVASIGGNALQYQVNLDPNLMRAYAIPFAGIVDAIRNGNKESSGRLLEAGGIEYMVRGHGYVHSAQDLADIPLGVTQTGSQLRVKDVGRVGLGPDLRRGTVDLDGKGEVVSGIVVMRNGENALKVIEGVKAKLRQVERSLPEGIAVVPIYDRSELIQRTIGTVTDTAIEVGVTVALIILIFLWHFPSAAIPIITMPVAVLLAFIPFHMLGLSLNVMSLAGFALAFSQLVDASIVVAEQVQKKLEVQERTGRLRSRTATMLEAMREVSVPACFALVVIAVSFVPILSLAGPEGRMFRPLAYAKSVTLLVAAALVVTLDPALRILFASAEQASFRPYWLSRFVNRIAAGRVPSEERHPLSRLLIRVYEPVVRWTLERRTFVIAAAVAAVIVTIPVFKRLGSDSMPPLEEGAILYMPGTLPGISISQAEKLLHQTDTVIRTFPQVEHVLGKAGRAETATDPAPLSMLETVITLKPKSEWPRVGTWYSGWAPEWARNMLRHITPDTISSDELVEQMNAALRVPGLKNGWTMPIRGRIDMLNSGIRSPVGLKITGADLEQIQAIGVRVESALRAVPGTRSVLAERTAEGFYLDLDWNRERLAQYGLSIADVQDVVEHAIGGDNVTTLLIGPERYRVNVRYQRDFRSDVGAISRIPVGGAGKPHIPLGDLAKVSLVTGPAMVRDENGSLTGFVYVDVTDTDIESYVNQANQVLREQVKLPTGYMISWSGQYETLQQLKSRLKVVVPITLALIGLLLVINTGSISKALIVLTAVPFSAVGAIWLLYAMGYHMSAAVWVGLIALLGVDAETGVFMLLYLDLARDEALRCGRLRNRAELHEAIVHGAAKRIRPKFMTFATCCIGLFPVMWANGSGADVMKRIAAPMVGGIFTSFLLELLVYPAIYEIWRGRAFSESPRASVDVIAPGSILPASGD